jgi:hypothetical protein
VNGARISVDGKQVGTSPIKTPVFVDPGRRTIEATLDDYETAKKTIDAAKGSSREVKLSLVPKPKPTPKIAEQGWRPSPILYAIGGGAALVSVGIGAGLTAAANGKGTDAEALRASVGSSSACYQPTLAQAQTCSDLSDALKSKDSLSNAAVGMFVVGGALAIGTAGLFVYSMMVPRPSDETAAPKAAAASLRIIPIVDEANRGVMVVGAW